MNNQNTQNNTNSNKSNFQSSGMNTSKKNSDLQETIMKQIHDLGDSIERAGERVEKAGWEKIGQAIYSLGNTLEHLNEGKGVKADFSKDTAKKDVGSDFASASKDSLSKTDVASKPGKSSAY